MVLKVTSTAFEDKGNIPQKYACPGDGNNPPLQWQQITGAKSYVIIMEDLDVPGGQQFIHWLVPFVKDNIIAANASKQKETDTLLQGINTKGTTQYFGPCPPIGDKPHRYVFQVFALSLDLKHLCGNSDEPCNIADIRQAMDDHVLDRGKLTGLYQRTE